MKKIIIGIVIGLLLGLIGYLASTLYYSHEFISYDLASVTIRNESGQTVKKIFLKHGHGTLEATDIGNGDQIRFLFTNSGENSYDVTVTLDNDSVLKSNSVYFEYGYRGTETITKSEITTKNNW
jgi:hypothetical protein